MLYILIYSYPSPSVAQFKDNYCSENGPEGKSQSTCEISEEAFQVFVTQSGALLG